MYYLTHATLKDPSWGSIPYKVEILEVSTDIKGLQEQIKLVYDSNFEEGVEEEYSVLDLDYDFEFNYLMYFDFEDNVPTTHFYYICSWIAPKEIDK